MLGCFICIIYIICWVALVTIMILLDLCYHCWVASLVPMMSLALAVTWWLHWATRSWLDLWYVSIKGTCQGHGEIMVKLVKLVKLRLWHDEVCMCSSALVKNTNVIMYGFQRSMKGHCPTQCDSLGISKPKAPCTQSISDCVVDMVSRYDIRIWQEVTIGFLGSHGISQWLHPAQRTTAPRRFRTAMHRWIGTTRCVSHVAGRFLVMTSSS